MRPLEGLIVLDFSTLLPGPLATEVLVQAGARVIKIERPGSGDDMRGYQPAWDGSSANFAVLNAGKESVAIDLKDPAARPALERMIRRADILIEQFRPGVMARLGLDYDAAASLNPKLIYCSISGFGQTGPKRDVAAHDLNYIGETGLLSLSMGDGPRPVMPPALIADIAAGTYPALLNILMALHQRERSGRGCHLDIAMTDHLFTFMYWVFAGYHASGRWPEAGRALVTGGSPRYNLYPTRDGRVVAAAPIEPKFWENFCSMIELDADCRDDDIDPERTRRRVAELIAARDAADWAAIFAGADCCCTIVRTPAEAMADPHFQQRGLFAGRVRGPSGTEMPAAPMPLAPIFRPPGGAMAEVPRLGRDTPDAPG